MNKAEENTLLYTLLPSSIKNEEVFKKASLALYKNDDSKSHLNDGFFYARLDEVKGDTLDHLAKQWHVLVWRDSWDDATKRNVLRSTIQSLRILGTKAAIINVLSGLNGRAELTEWYEMSPQGTPHTFKVDVYQEAGFISEDTFSDLVRMINQAKPVRSQYTFKAIQELEAEGDFSTSFRTFVYTHFYTNPTLYFTFGTETDTNAGVQSVQYARFNS